jgi:hypothetical protein
MSPFEHERQAILLPRKASLAEISFQPLKIGGDMHNRSLKIFLTLILCLISSSYFVAFANAGKSVYDLLSSKGFDEKNRHVTCQIKDSKIMKNANEDVPLLLEKLKKVAVSEGVVEPSDFTIGLENGSSFSWQTITISVAKTGNGYVQYMKERKVFFKSADLYKFCEAAFSKSKIPIH